jgi:hypothetical protein
MAERLLKSRKRAWVPRHDTGVAVENPRFSRQPIRWRASKK